MRAVEMGSLRSKIVLASSALLMVGAGCSSSDTASPSPPKDGALQAPPAGKGFQLGFQRSIKPGVEVHICREFVMPGNGEIAIEKFEPQVPAGGTHHLLGYRSPTKAADVTDEVFDCGDVPGPIVFTQTADGIGADWPEGVGVKFQGGDVLRLELHYLNLTSKDSVAEVRFNAWLAEAPLDAEAGSLFMYDRDIAVPAHGKFTAKMHCEIPQDITILNILPHLHVHGVGERIFLSGGELTEPKQILESTGYGDLEARHFDADPLVVKKGQALDYECDYSNDTGEDVVEGPSKEHNEMCMILGDYYPRMETPGEWCTLVGSGPVHEGTKTCKEAYDALGAGKNVDFASEEIIVDVCATANPAWNALGNCAFNHCSDLCPGPDCATCASKSCVKEYFTCQSAACD